MGIRSFVFKGGTYKAPIGLLGDITKENIQHVQSMIDHTHEAFQHHVITQRPILTDTIQTIGNGNIWLGYYAIDLNLIDRIITSDEYIHERIYHDHARVYQLVQLSKSKYPFMKPNIQSTSRSSTSSSPYAHLKQHQSPQPQIPTPSLLSPYEASSIVSKWKQHMMQIMTDHIIVPLLFL
jgi:ClpP class serine protease